jgi:hypothetical protein
MTYASVVDNGTNDPLFESGISTTARRIQRTCPRSSGNEAALLSSSAASVR